MATFFLLSGVLFWCFVFGYICMVSMRSVFRIIISLIQTYRLMVFVAKRQNKSVFISVHEIFSVTLDIFMAFPAYVTWSDGERSFYVPRNPWCEIVEI